MPSPFPGMDPYLESPTRWRGVHHLFVTYLAAEMNRHLPETLVAVTEERCYLLPRSEVVIPDSMVVHSPVVPQASLTTSTAVLERATLAGEQATPSLLIELDEVEVREPYVEIVSADSDERVVTVIELLSPSNKVPGVHGRDEYVDKRDAVLNSASHLLEIDLLRGGVHTVAVERAKIVPKKPFDYLVCLHRAGGGRRHFECWPFELREAMPRVRVPLTPELPDLVVDLQAVLNRVYDEGTYWKRLHYADEAEPPLSASDAAWAGTLLRQKGLRA